jgi:hypothetical protein
MQLDESQLSPEHKRFLEQWATDLTVPVDVLLGRIVEAACYGEQYVEKVPDYCP